MDGPDPDTLRTAIEALEDERLERAGEALHEALGEHPTGAIEVEDVDAEASSLAEKAWSCVELARRRLDEERVTSARVMLHSAVEHAEGNIDPDETLPEAGMFGEEAIENALEQLDDEDISR